MIWHWWIDPHDRLPHGSRLGRVFAAAWWVLAMAAVVFAWHLAIYG